MESNGFLNSSIAQVPKIGTHITCQKLTSWILPEQTVVKTKLDSLSTEVRVTIASKGKQGHLGSSVG